MLRLGKISELGTDKHLGFARVFFDEVNMVSGWLPLPSIGTKTVKHWQPIEINSQVACLMDDDCEQGYVAAVLWNDDDQPPEWAEDNSEDRIGIQFADGATFYYDAKTHELIIEAPESEINITCKNLNLSGNLVIAGDQTVSGSITATGEVQAGIIKLTQHKHPTPSGVSGIPTP